MYSFPPEPWIATEWYPNLVYAPTLLLGIALIYWLTSAKKKPRRVGAILVMVVVITQSILFESNFGASSLELQSHGLFHAVAWGFAIWRIGVHEMHLRELFPQKVIDFNLIICLVMFFGAFIPIFGYRLGITCGTRETSRLMECRNNLKQIGLGLHNYHDTYERFPTWKTGQPPHSWRVDLLPFLDQAPLYEQYDFNEEWKSGSNELIARTRVYPLHCPSVPVEASGQNGFPFSGYATLVGEETMWKPDEPLNIKEITDGTSSTLMVVEACGHQIPWSEPKDLRMSEIDIAVNSPGKSKGRSNGLLSSYHVWSGAFALLADGSVEHFNTETDPTILKALTTANGGEEVSEF